MSVVLVTGASGFLGRQTLIPLNERGFTVHAVARHPLADLPAIWHKVDLFDATERRRLVETVRPTHLLHLAWEARHGYFWEAPENLDWVGVTLDLMRLFQAVDGVRAVFAGSCAEYDWRPEALGDGVCLERKTPCRPFSLYGLAKAATHDLIAAYAARSRLGYAWGRVFLLYGPFETKSRLVPSVVSALLAGQAASLGDGKRTRDFLDVRDAGRAFAALIDSSVVGPVNIGSGDGTTIAHVAHRLAMLLSQPSDLLEFGVRSPNGNDPLRLVADIKRLREEVGFSPNHVLDEGLADAVAWWQGRVHGKVKRK